MGIQPKRDLSRFVRWPKYIRLQRHKTVLMERLKVPPPVNQFRQTLDRQTATQMFKLMDKYRPESKQAKKMRLRARAQLRARRKPSSSLSPTMSTQLSWSSSCLPCAAKWEFLIALSRTRPVLDVSSAARLAPASPLPRSTLETN